ncbi:MAG: CvpA family protein [Holosporales bacterium]|jgi:membrane protein required for colicin V production|nr:CvpA family protein [Holosporales bacterium]
MNTVDFVILGVMLISVIIGFAKGFIRELSSILAWILAGIATFWDIPMLRTFMRAHFDTVFIADVAAVAFACIIAFTIVSFIGTICSGFVRGTFISPLDRFFGAALSGCKCVFLLSCIEIGTGFFVPRNALPDKIVQSSLIGIIYYVSDQLQKALPPKIQSLFKEFSNQKGVVEESVPNENNPEVENLGKLEPKKPDDSSSGVYTDDQIDQLNRVIGSTI